MSLWLPVGRANYYSPSGNAWLVTSAPGDWPLRARSRMLEDPAYTPRLQVSVLRRVLEVLPFSFGYKREGICDVVDLEQGERPVAVTMTLLPKLDMPEGPGRDANRGLAEAGVDAVTARVDEQGAYTFRAESRSGDPEQIRTALAVHVRGVLGGGFSLAPGFELSYRGRDGDARGAAIRRYQGLDTDSVAGEGKPLGILTFFQLNVLVDGLFNKNLSPAVFFGRHDHVQSLSQGELGTLTLVRNIGEVASWLLVVDVDASTPDGLVVVLRRFLDVTSNEVLHGLRSSVESVRRSLIDESVATLHRQARLVTADLAAFEGEWTPHLAVGASEAQLRGYLTFLSLQLPHIAGVHAVAVLVYDHLVKAADRDPTLGNALPDLDTDIKHWDAMLRRLVGDVDTIQNAVDQVSRGRLTYEQDRLHDEQEVIAAIERSRAGRPAAARASASLYNLLMLLLAALAVLLAVGNGPDAPGPSVGWLSRTVALWLIAALVVAFYVILPLIGQLRRAGQDKRGISEGYQYAFSFNVLEEADPYKVHANLNSRRRRRPKSMLKKFSVTSQGGGRIDELSEDRTMFKIYTVASFRVGPGRYARFEIVSELLAHTDSGKNRYTLVGCRMFGESPTRLTTTEALDLITAVFLDVGAELTKSGDVETDLARALRAVTPLYAQQRKLPMPAVSRGLDADGLASRRTDPASVPSQRR